MDIDTQKILAQLDACVDEGQLEDFFQQHLGKKGLFNTAFRELKNLEPEAKKKQGNIITSSKNAIQSAYESRVRNISIKRTNEKLIKQDSIDISVSSPSSYEGHTNLLARERRHVEEVAKGMGMTVEYGHDIVSKYENFYSVNIPADHPATEMHDTIYTKLTDSQDEHYVLRTHTSAHQVQYIKQYGAPLSFLSIGRVYRYEKLDASHDTAFRQVEGMVIDEDISIAHFKSFMIQFLSALFEEDKKIRLRPSYFPFVEPGFEIDVNYNIGNNEGEDNRLELLGAGMIHPHVLKEGGLNPQKYSGFAFGIGLTRLVAIKHKLKDIRLLTNGDMRFVKSF